MRIASRVYEIEKFNFDLDDDNFSEGQDEKDIKDQEDGDLEREVYQILREKDAEGNDVDKEMTARFFKIIRDTHVPAMPLKDWEKQLESLVQ